MHIIRFLCALFLLSSCTLLFAGCGTTSTAYTFSSPSTARQRSQIIRAVDSTARVLNLTRRTGPSFESDEAFFHTYLNGSLTIQTSSGDGRAYASLSKAGRTKSPDFVTAEGMLTPSLRQIDPHLSIKTGYAPNPMM